MATTGQVFLGLTVDCARCHDHKIDPIPQKDYYRLLAFFHNINHYRNGGPTDEYPIVEPGTERAYAERVRELESRRKAAQATVTGLEEEFRKRYAPPSGRDRPRDRPRRPPLPLLPRHLGPPARLRRRSSPRTRATLPVGLFDLAPRTRDEAFGFVFEGTLIVARGRRVHVPPRLRRRLPAHRRRPGRREHDGIHELGREQIGRASSSPTGRVPIRLEYFQKGDGLGLDVAWSGPGFERRSLSASKRESKAIDVRSLIRSEGRTRARPGADRALPAGTPDPRRDAETQGRSATTALCVTEPGPIAPETFVLLRGNAHTPGDKVEPGFLEVLGTPAPTIPPPPAGAKTSGRRRVLADWIASPENPLTARVMANRVWQHHFGRGIVRSPNNFGTQGDAPTHPELLDWLASEFVAEGWRLKPLHRLIMTSNAYRMSSRANPEALAKDPTNDLFWRFDMRRLTAEEIRDSILAVTGTPEPQDVRPEHLSRDPDGGAGRPVACPGTGWGKSPPEEQARRSVYIHVKRSLLMPILEGFDVAETDRTSPVRFSHDPADAGAGDAQRRVPQRAGRSSWPTGSAARPATTPRRRSAWRLRLVTGRDPSEADVTRGRGPDRVALEARRRSAPEAPARRSAWWR